MKQKLEENREREARMKLHRKQYETLGKALIYEPIVLVHSELVGYFFCMNIGMNTQFQFLTLTGIT